MVLEEGEDQCGGCDGEGEGRSGVYGSGEWGELGVGVEQGREERDEYLIMIMTKTIREYKCWIGKAHV